MPTQLKMAKGTTLSRAGANVIAELTGITPPQRTREAQDGTHLTSPNDYREYVAGWKDGGTVEVEGNWVPGDTDGQAGLESDFENGTLQTFEIAFPVSTGASISFSGIVTKAPQPTVTTEGKLGFTASIKVSGKPTLNVGVSGGLTGLTGVNSAAGALDFIPNFAGATTEYSVSVANTVTYVKFTPTAGNHAITITANGQSQVVASGTESGQIALGAAGTILNVVIEAKEANKVAKRYTIHVVKAE